LGSQAAVWIFRQKNKLWPEGGALVVLGLKGRMCFLCVTHSGSCCCCCLLFFIVVIVTGLFLFLASIFVYTQALAKSAHFFAAWPFIIAALFPFATFKSYFFTILSAH